MQGKQAQIEVSQLYTIYVVYFDKVGSGTTDEQGRKRGGEREPLNRLRIKMLPGHLPLKRVY